MASRRAKARKPALKPRKSPVQERAQATVDAILQASTYILKKDGYAYLTTNRIAEKAGVNIASLYQYFPNKEAIFVELLRRHAEAGRRMSTQVLEGKWSSKAKVEQIIAGTIAAHAVDPELHRIFTVEGARLGLKRAETDADAKLVEQSEQWVKTTRRKNAKLALWIADTAVHAVVHAAFAEHPEYARSPELAGELSQLVLRYLRR